MRRCFLKGLIIVLAGYILFFLSGCNFAPFQGEGQVLLDLSWLYPDSGDTAGGSRAATVSGGPSNIQGKVTSIEITVSGSGMNTETRTYTKWPRYLSVSVPPGKQRTIELRINVDPASDSAILAFGGEATLRYVSAGEQEKVQLSIAPVETKIVLPDMNNNRIVQLSSLDMATANWQQYVLGGFLPIDVDFDNKGRIVVVNNAGAAQVTILDDYTNSHLTFTTAGLTSVAVDRGHRYFYFSNNTDILQFEYSVDEARLVLITNKKPDPNISAISGMAVDNVGMLYITCLLDRAWIVAKYDYANGVFIQGPELQNPQDVIVKDNYVYVICSGTPALVRLNRNLDAASLVNYGQKATDNSDTTPGHFHGPCNFVAILNKKFYIVDDGKDMDPGPNKERIVAFDSPGSWNGWEAKEAFEIKAAENFLFYGSC